MSSRIAILGLASGVVIALAVYRDGPAPASVAASLVSVAATTGAGATSDAEVTSMRQSSAAHEAALGDARNLTIHDLTRALEAAHAQRLALRAEQLAQAEGPTTTLLGAAQPAVSADLTAEEQAVLVLFENISSAFDAQALDCAELGRAVSEFVEEGAADASAFAAARAELSSEERATADERIEREAAGQFAQLRASIRHGLAKCPEETRLQDAIHELAAMAH